MSNKRINLKPLFSDGQVIAVPDQKAHATRLNGDETATEDAARTAFDRDYARVLHSSSFRRLQGKMQLLRHQDSDFYRTRLTHSLEVSQIGEGIARRCDPSLDVSVVRLACLAHDIGNPPFGHYGELVLNRLMQGDGGFEGNAQTLRILSRLERKKADVWGLDLTLAARLSVLKYNITFTDAKKQAAKGKLPAKFIYDEDAELVQSDGGLAPLSVECQAMDLADDIANATHDLEDGIHAGLLETRDVIDTIRRHKKHDSMERKAAEEQFCKALEDAEKSCGVHSGPVFEKAVTAVLVNTFIGDIFCEKMEPEVCKKRGHKKTRSLGFEKCGALVSMLKDTAYKGIVEHPSIAAYETAGGLVIEELFNALTDTNYNRDNRLLPEQYRQRMEMTIDKLPRTVCDYLAGMTETFILKLYETHFGRKVPTFDVQRNLGRIEPKK